MKQKTSLFQVILNSCKNFWFFGILFLVFSFLDALENFVVFSNFLSLILEEWRNILSIVWSFPTNLVLRIFKLDPIIIPSPWPEILTFLGMLFFTALNKKEIEKTKLGRWLLVKNFTFRDYFTSFLNFEKIKISHFLIYIFGFYISFIILFLPYVLVGSTLLSPIFPWPLSFFIIFIPIMIMISLADLLPSKNNVISETIELHGYVVMPIVMVFSLLFILVVSALEILIPGISSFVERANSQ